jgi:uncharacterized protein YukE
MQYFAQKEALPSAKELNRYVDTLSRKIAHRPPSFQEVDAQYRSIAKKYPMAMLKQPQQQRHKQHVLG